MAFKSKGSDPASIRAEDKAKAEAAPKADSSPIKDLLAMETVARDLALNYPDGPNCDAVKSALTNAAHGIAHVRKALANNERLAER